MIFLKKTNLQLNKSLDSIFPLAIEIIGKQCTIGVIALLFKFCLQHFHKIAAHDTTRLKTNMLATNRFMPVA